MLQSTNDKLQVESFYILWPALCRFHPILRFATMAETYCVEHLMKLHCKLSSQQCISRVEMIDSDEHLSLLGPLV
jgi:hypothetical protein